MTAAQTHRYLDGLLVKRVNEGDSARTTLSHVPKSIVTYGDSVRTRTLRSFGGGFCVVPRTIFFTVSDSSQSHFYLDSHGEGDSAYSIICRSLSQDRRSLNRYCKEAKVAAIKRNLKGNGDLLCIAPVASCNNILRAASGFSRRFKVFFHS